MEQISHITVDAFVGFVVFVSLVIGWIRGATREIFSVISWIGGIYLTVLFFPQAKGIARSHIDHGLIADFVTACVLFIIFLTLLSLLNYFFSNFVKKSALNTTDKALGGVFGIARAAVLLAIVDIVLFQYVLTETPEWVKHSKTHPIISSVSNFIILVLPDALQDKIVSHLSMIKKQSLMDFVKDNVIENLDGDLKEDLLQDNEINKVVAEGKIQLEDIEEDDDDDDTNISVIDEKESNPQTAKNLATLKPKRVTDGDKERETPVISERRVRMDMDRILAQTADE
ncbi:MAG: CvpA family protein [Holosporales bacterium]|jgi:membrane protein required for colicin V production|nr:CvpA family protein [Holosporales bacterium]